MTRIILITVFLVSYTGLESQPNCYVFKEDPECYEACNTAMQAIRHYQGSSESQQLFDKSINQCPSFAYSYMEKAVPYLKRGLFIEWKVMIDKAVELEPVEYLGYRGWCRLQFLRDYSGAIEDILQLKQIYPHDIGYCQTGDYHLDVALALSYKELGQLDLARTILTDHVNKRAYTEEPYDYYHLGVIEYELGNYISAKSWLVKQNGFNRLAEAYYVLSLIAHKQGLESEGTTLAIKAKEAYINGHTMFDTYTEPFDKVYLSDIESLF